MDLIFDFDRRQGITNVRFDGLDGSEDVTSVKEALGLLKIRNPAITFAEAASNGTYGNMTDTEYTKMLKTVKCISALWRYPGGSEERTRNFLKIAFTLDQSFSIGFKSGLYGGK